MESMYEILMQLPIFQGISRTKISELIEKTKFHFLKYQDKEPVLTKGETYPQLKFLISGSLRVVTGDHSGKIKISEIIHAPNIIVPNYLFGMNTVSPSDVFASESAGIMQFDKSTFIKILQSDPIALINVLNLLSQSSQRGFEMLYTSASGDIKKRFAQWVLNTTGKRASDIRIECKQKDLYAFFGVQRSAFVNMLNEMEEDGILTFDTNGVQIISRDRLYDVVKSLTDSDEEL